jgi:DNA-binding beta-propeller fold protein YncE
MNRTIAISSLVLVLSAIPGPVIAQSSFPAPGFQTSGLAYDEIFVYVAELSGPRLVFTLDPATGDVLGSFQSPSPTGLDGRGNPSDMVADGSGFLFVTDIGVQGAGIVYEIDSAGTTIVNSLPLPFRGGAIAFDGAKLYVADFDSDQILVMDPSGTPLDTLAIGLRPAGMVFDPAANLLWVISQFDTLISQVTLDGRKIRSCLGPRQPGPQGLGAITKVGSKLYIGEAGHPDSPEVPGTIFIVDPSTLDCSPPLAFPVEIDVAPGNPMNVVNPRSRGMIRVAILSGPSFDATTVNPETVRFGVTGSEAPVEQVHLMDVNGDGIVDMRLGFRQHNTGIVCGSESVVLLGGTAVGRAFEGSDFITTVGCVSVAGSRWTGLNVY